MKSTFRPPSPRPGAAALTEVQHWFYHQVLDPTFTGRAHVPNHTNYLVVRITRHIWTWVL